MPAGASAAATTAEKGKKGTLRCSMFRSGPKGVWEGKVRRKGRAW